MKTLLAVVLGCALSAPLCAETDVVCSSSQTTCGGGAAGASTSGNNSWTGTQTFIDNKFLITDDAAPTKVGAFQLSGITAGQTRTMTFPDSSFTPAGLALDNVWGGHNRIQDGFLLQFGSNAVASTSDSFFFKSTTNTPDGLVLALGQLSRNLDIIEASDEGFDFARAQQTTPTLTIHSAAQSTTQYVSMTHNGTNANLATGTGAIYLSPKNSDGFAGYTGVLGTLADDQISGGASLLYFGGSINQNYAFLGGPAISGLFTLKIGNASATANRLFTNSPGLVISVNTPDSGVLNHIATITTSARIDAFTISPELSVGPGVSTGTNTAGRNLTLFGGRGTGTGAAGDVIVQAAPSLATGTTAHTLATRERIVAKAKALTDATATTVFTVTGLGAHIRTGGSWDLCVDAGDGTNDQEACCRAEWSAVDTTAGAGGETCGVFLDATCSALLRGAASSGTLSVTADATTGTDTCNYRLNADTSLTATTLQATYTVYQHGAGTINPQ